MNNRAIVMYVNQSSSVLNCAFLIESIRQFGGVENDIPIIVMHDPSANLNLDPVALPKVSTHPFKVPEKYQSFPSFSKKVHACAAAEELYADIVDTLIYFDTEMVCVSDFSSIHLQSGFNVSFRPVMLVNSVGISNEEAIGGYWERILSELSVEKRSIPTINAYVDEKEILFYINYEAIVVRAKLGIFRKWNFFLLIRSHCLVAGYIDIN